jgi:hypothetical protein
MMIIQNNQALKIEIQFDNDAACYGFEEFLKTEGFERLDNAVYICIKLPFSKRFAKNDLTTDSTVIKRLHALDLAAIDVMDLSDAEKQALEEALLNDTPFDVETAKRDLLSLCAEEWINNLIYDVGPTDWHDEMTGFGCCGHFNDGVVAYVQGAADETEEIDILNTFELYGFETPYYFAVDLIDCETGDVIDDASLGGIYDSSCQLSYLSESIAEALDNMTNINAELKTKALDELSKMDYSSIPC